VKAPLAALGLSLFVAAAGAGLAMPVIPAIVSAAGGTGAAYGFLVSIAALSQLLFSPFWGYLADRIGRKPVLSIGLAGFAASLLAFAVAETMGSLLLARAATGLLSSAILPAALAAAGDLSGEKERMGTMGRLMAVFSLGAIVGPGLGGLLGEIGLRAPLYIGAGIAALSLLLVAFVMPETSGAARPAAATGAAPPVGLADGSRALVPLLALMLVATFGTSCFHAVFGMDATGRFAMGPGAVGGLLAGVAAAAAIVQGLLSGPASRRFGDETLVTLSMFGGAAGFAVLGLAWNAVSYAAAAIVYVLAHALLRPALQTIASKRGDEGRGASMGLASSAQGLGAALGPLAAGPLLDLDPRLPYLLGALVLAGTGFASGRALRRKEGRAVGQVGDAGLRSGG
jgi:DHA1 family multidrug resistance protein-like MFS transporter